jgi:hypothetical protein
LSHEQDVGTKWEGPAWVSRQPGTNLGLLVGGVIVQDNVDGFVGGHFGFDGIQKADKLLMRCLCMLRPITEPSRILRAANRVEMLV